MSPSLGPLSPRLLGLRPGQSDAHCPRATGRAREVPQGFVHVTLGVGEVLVWESWLRHEAPVNMSEEERISVSFNCRWG